MHNIDVITDAIIYPAIDDWLTNTGYTHGVSSGDLKQDRPDFGQIKFKKSLINYDKRLTYKSSTPKRIKGRWCYLGGASSHFGHFLSECISRYWVIDEIKNLVDGFIILPNKHSNTALKFVSDVFNLFEIKEILILDVNEYSIVDTLFIPRPGKIFGENTEYWFLSYLKNKNPQEKNINENLPKKLFVSRRNFLFVGRLAGMDAVTNELAKFDYYELFPEKYSLRRQIEFICSAEIIVWEEGSAIHLLELLPFINSKNILIQRRPPENYNYFYSLLKEKTKDLVTWANVEFIKSELPPHNRMSKINDHSGFFTFLKKHLLVNVNADFFFACEQLDILKATINEAHKNNSSKNERLKEILDHQNSITSNFIETLLNNKIHREEIVARTNQGNILAWSIDFPPKGYSFSKKYENLNITGWILIKPELYKAPPTIKITNIETNQYTTVNLEINRPDVINQLLKKNDYPQQQLTCGFSYQIPISWKQVYVQYDELQLSRIIIYSA